MDIFCRRCDEPWEVSWLRKEATGTVCPDCEVTVVQRPDGTWRHFIDGGACSWAGAAPTMEHEAAHNGEVPDEVRQHGAAGWLRYVVVGKGCPSCHGTPAQDVKPKPLTLSELDHLIGATEGECDAWLIEAGVI